LSKPVEKLILDFYYPIHPLLLSSHLSTALLITHPRPITNFHKARTSNMASTRAVYIIAAKRTPFGSFGGSLKNTSATELAAEATRSALSSLPPGTVGAPDVDQIYVGNVVQTGSDAAYLARHVGLMCGTPVASPALTLNRLCGSGFETVVQGADAIRLGRADVAVCAGTENMSSAPFVADGNSVRWVPRSGAPCSWRIRCGRV